MSCNSTGVVCAGQGTCVNGTCECNNLFEPTTECATTFFATWGDSIVIISAITIAFFGFFFLVAGLDLIFDLRRLRFRRVLKAPFAWAKFLILVFSLFLIIESAWYILNASEGREVLVMVPLRNAAAGVYFVAFAIFVTLIIFSWIEIIERARTLDDALWLKKIRIATIVILVLVIALNVVLMPIRFSMPLNKTNEMLSLTQNMVDGVFVLYLIIISTVMLLRGRKWWQDNGGDIVKLARRKTKFFIMMLVVLGVLVIFAVASAMLKPGSSTHLINNTIWNAIYVCTMGTGFLFIQSNIHRNGQWFISGTGSDTASAAPTKSAVSNSRRNNSSTRSKSKDNDGTKRQSTASTLDPESSSST